MPAGPITDTVLREAVERFGETYDRLHGTGAGYRQGGVTLTGLRVRASGVSTPPELADAAPADITESERPVYWSEYGEFRPTRVLTLTRGGRLDSHLSGPLLVELPDTVVVVRPEQTARFDHLGNLIIDLSRTKEATHA
jgi:N-methylhydantoinase A